jgi:hypothetical protein
MPYQFIGKQGPFWQPDTRVQTYPSGLVLIQRTLVCTKTHVAQTRQTVAQGAPLPCSAPTLEPVSIFPTPQETERDGFVYFDVSGYGRANLTGSNRVVNRVLETNTYRWQGPWWQRYGTLIGPPIDQRGMRFKVEVIGRQVESEIVLPSTEDVRIDEALLQFATPRLNITEPGNSQPFPPKVAPQPVSWDGTGAAVWSASVIRDTVNTQITDNGILASFRFEIYATMLNTLPIVAAPADREGFTSLIKGQKYLITVGGLSIQYAVAPSTVRNFGPYNEVFTALTPQSVSFRLGPFGAGASGITDG